MQGWGSHGDSKKQRGSEPHLLPRPLSPQIHAALFGTTDLHPWGPGCGAQTMLPAPSPHLGPPQCHPPAPPPSLVGKSNTCPPVGSTRQLQRFWVWNFPDCCSLLSWPGVPGWSSFSGRHPCGHTGLGNGHHSPEQVTAPGRAHTCPRPWAASWGHCQPTWLSCTPHSTHGGRGGCVPSIP